MLGIKVHSDPSSFPRFLRGRTHGWTKKLQSLEGVLLWASREREREIDAFFTLTCTADRPAHQCNNRASWLAMVERPKFQRTAAELCGYLASLRCGLGTRGSNALDSAPATRPKPHSCYYWYCDFFKCVTVISAVVLEEVLCISILVQTFS